jgi:hypothetical protein
MTPAPTVSSAHAATHADQWRRPKLTAAVASPIPSSACKLDVDDRTAAVTMALERGIIRLERPR